MSAHIAHHAPVRGERQRPWLPAALAALLAVALYAVTIGANYIFDDVGILLNDPRLRCGGNTGRRAITTVWTTCTGR
jgi:hypothetical protein